MYIAPELEKKYDLSFKINSQLGFGHLRRNLFNINFMLTVNSQGQQILALPSNMMLSMGECSILQIFTDTPLTFEGTKEDDTTFGFTVQKMLLLDQPVKSWVLANYSGSEAKVKIVWGSTDATVSNPQPVTGFVTRVNGQLPDSTGNVEVDTGVMTINKISPVEGNIDTDEGAY